VGTWRLVDGDVTVAGDLVLRPARPWSPTVHALLTHLRAAGLDCVPEPVGIRDGVEAVRFVAGDAGPDAWRHQVSEAGLTSAARLLRQVHDASAGFVPPAGARWAFPAGRPAEVICHGDPGPWNFVWRGGCAVALIDWEYASPGPALDDVAAALDSFTPFRPDDVAIDHGFAEPPDRRARLTAFAAAYGTGGTAGLVDRVIERQQATVARVVDLAERGLEPWASWVRSGGLDVLRSRPRWTREHRHLVE
jgi:Ser/Thr protein kinase RdoA (MazF antagonist)